MTKAVCPGSYCPITLGHENIISRASKLFDEVIVLIMLNPDKKYDFSLDERVEMANKVLSKYKNVKVEFYEGLIADYVKQNGVNVVIKGIRSSSDFEYESQMARVNKQLYDGFETFFILSDEKYSFISSSVVRQIASFGGCIKSFVPEEICDIIYKKYN